MKRLVLITFSRIEALQFSCNYTHVYPATADVFPVVVNTRSKLVEKQSKYPKEYSTVDKVGSEEPLTSKSFFV